MCHRGAAGPAEAADVPAGQPVPAAAAEQWRGPGGRRGRHGRHQAGGDGQCRGGRRSGGGVLVPCDAEWVFVCSRLKLVTC